MLNPRIVFMGTPDFAVPCLETLIEEGYDIAAVVTQPDRPKGRGQKLTPSPVKEKALAQNIKVLQPDRVKDSAFIEELTAIKPDLIIVVAFGQFLPKVLLELPPLGCINVHASLLPKYRGAAPIHWSVINGETVTGVTTMYMDVGMDTGDMILKAEMDIKQDDSTGFIHDELKVMGADILKKTVKMIISNQAPRKPQDKDAASYAPLLTRALEHIDWNGSAVQIHNLVRGLNPWPGAYCRHQNKTLKIWTTSIFDKDKIGIPGRIESITDQGILVETGKGIIELRTIQPESKRRMSARDYASGYCLIAGDVLG